MSLRRRDGKEVRKRKIFDKLNEQDLAVLSTRGTGRKEPGVAEIRLGRRKVEEEQVREGGVQPRDAEAAGRLWDIRVEHFHRIQGPWPPGVTWVIGGAGSRTPRGG